MRGVEQPARAPDGWLMPYAEGERHAAGDGLPRWAEQGRPLVDADVVPCYTLGYTHLPRPAACLGFLLNRRAGWRCRAPAPPAARALSGLRRAAPSWYDLAYKRRQR